MFIYQGKRINIYAPFTAPDGSHGWDLSLPQHRTHWGISEVPEPEAPADYSEDTYYRTEQDEAPYVVYTRKSAEQIAVTTRSKLQAQMTALDGGDPMARAMREFMLLSMENEAAKVGITPEQLRTVHYAYRKVKELDETIAGIRSAIADLSSAISAGNPV